MWIPTGKTGLYRNLCAGAGNISGNMTNVWFAPFAGNVLAMDLIAYLRVDPIGIRACCAGAGLGIQGALNVDVAEHVRAKMEILEVMNIFYHEQLVGTKKVQNRTKWINRKIFQQKPFQIM